MRKILYSLILASMLFFVCGCDGNEKPDLSLTLKDRHQWEENSKQVELLKKQNLAGFPQLTINEGLEKMVIEEWKYAKDGEKEYILCNYLNDNQPESIVFVIDSFGEVCVEAYYIDNKEQNVNKIKDMMQERFTKKEEVKKETKKEDDKKEEPNKENKEESPETKPYELINTDTVDYSLYI